MADIRTNMIGLAGEFRVMAELLLRGHNPAKSYLENGADLVLENGLRIEVKSSHKHKINRATGYHFSFRGGHRKERQNLDGCDFAVCWCIDENCFYIIPTTEIKSSAAIICDISGTKSKYAIYKNKWELLKTEVKQCHIQLEGGELNGLS